MQFQTLYSRDISTFPIPPTQKSKLLTKGYKFVNDFNDVGPVELAKG